MGPEVILYVLMTLLLLDPVIRLETRISELILLNFASEKAECEGAN